MNKTQSAANTLAIPAEIAALPRITVLEKIALAHIVEDDACTNASLAKALGLSKRGIEAMLRRFRERGFIRVCGKGRARRITTTFGSEPHIACSKTDEEKTHIRCEVEKQGLALVRRDRSITDLVHSELNHYQTCLEFANYQAAKNHLSIIRECLEADTKLPTEERSKLIAILVGEEDRCVAYGLGAEIATELPRERQRLLAITISRAPAEKLALIRERATSTALEWTSQKVVELLMDIPG